MDKEIVEEILKECKWYEIIIVKLLKKQFIKAYHIGRIRCWNSKK